jgi:glycosyltransferase involved in cell wall biosynthesis
MPIKGRLLYRDVETLMLRKYQPLLGTTQIVAEEIRAVTGIAHVPFCGNAPGIDPQGPARAIAGLPERFALAVGTVEPRKNYARLLEMADCEHPAALPVVLVGRAGWGPIGEAVAALAARRPTRLIWLRDLTDDDGLRWLYRRAECFVSLSLAEGFNMPLVEGAASGLPVVCSDIPIHRAVAPPWARFVDPIGDPARLWREVDLSRSTRPSAFEIDAYGRQYGWDQVATSLLRELALARPPRRAVALKTATARR